MTPFDFSLRTRVVFGPGTVDRTGELAREIANSRVFLVTDPGIVAAGHAERVTRSLQAQGLEVRTFTDVRENPTTEDVEACLGALGDWDAQLMVGLGGGSSLDVAKGCNFLRAGGGRMEDYWGVGKGIGTFVPLIAIPTTAGTGSELQSFALIGQAESHQKMACGDPKAAARAAILDPTLTITQPPFVTACTGLDTIAHAVETAVTKKRTAVSAIFSSESFRLAHRALPRVLEDPNDLTARGDMMLAAAYGGLAIENSMLGGAHSMANPLTAHYDIAHGKAVALMLPAIVDFNAGDPAIADTYAALARAAGLAAPEHGTAAAVRALIVRLHELLEVAGIDRSLAAHGVGRDKVDTLAAEAATQWTAQFNPRSVASGEFREMYLASFATA